MVLDALHAMGIDPAKPGEIIEYGRGPGGYTYEIEWPFISAAATAGDNGAGALQLAEGDVSWRPGGVPAPEFDRTQRRWSLSLLLRDVPWTLREPQPHT